MSKSIAILGAGGIGSCIGAYMSRAGYDITLIDQWAAHIDKIKNDGLKITDLVEEFSVKPKALQISEVSNLRDKFDIVYLSVKLYDTRWITYLIEPYLKPSGFILPVQNGLPDEIVAGVVGYPRTVGCVPLITAAVYNPGHVIRMDPMTTQCFIVGELSGIVSNRVKETVNHLANVGPSEPTSDIWGERWSKFIVNTMVNSLSGIIGPGISSLTKPQQHAASLIRVVTACEAIKVAHMLGILLKPVYDISADDYARASTSSDLEKLAERVESSRGKRRLSPEQIKKIGMPVQSSMLQDVVKGRRTEVEFYNGFIVQKGRELNIPTPMNASLVDILTKIERGEMKADTSNVELLEKHVTL